MLHEIPRFFGDVSEYGVRNWHCDLKTRRVCVVRQASGAMGIPAQLCRSAAGRAQLRHSERRRYPSWAAGIDLVRSIASNVGARDFFREPIDSGTPPPCRWCLFIRDKVSQSFSEVKSLQNDVVQIDSCNTSELSQQHAFSVWSFIESVAAHVHYNAGRAELTKRAAKAVSRAWTPSAQDRTASTAPKLLLHAYQICMLEVLFLMDETCRKTIQTIDGVRQQLNQFSMSMRNKATRSKVTADQKEANKTLKKREAELASIMKAQTRLRDLFLNRVGNVVIETYGYGIQQLGPPFTLRAPVGRGDQTSGDGEGILFRVHEFRERGHHFPQFSHDTLLSMIGGLHATKYAAKISGKRAYYLRGAALCLSQALINFSLQYLRTHECEILQPPEIMTAEMMKNVAQLDGLEDNLFEVNRKQNVAQDSSYLIATAEQPLCALFFRETFSRDSLPYDVGGISTCFRTEAGSQGEDTKGIFRVHQFEKVEQVTVSAPIESEKDFGRLMLRTMKFYQMLGLPFQVTSCAFSELTRTAAIKYDIEAWFPNSGQYREVVSCSNCTDFQARQLQMKVKNDRKARSALEHDDDSNSPEVISRGREAGTKPETGIPHLLNSTLMANTRTLSAILENYASPKGIIVPEVLRPYMPADLRQIIPYESPPPGWRETSTEGERFSWQVTMNNRWEFSALTPGPDNATAGTATVPASNVAAYTLLLKCVHPKGLRFRTSPQADPVFDGRGAKGTKSGSFIWARQDGEWFATVFSPQSVAGDVNEFSQHPAAGQGRELWLPAHSRGDHRNFEITPLPPTSISSELRVSNSPDQIAQASGDATSVDFEHDPAEDAQGSARTDPSSWGLGVLYQERRLDAGQPFTKEEFVEFYGGTSEWDAAEIYQSDSEEDQ